MRKWLLAVLTLAVMVAVAVAPTHADVSYVGSATIAQRIFPEAAQTFTARTGIPFGKVEHQGSGKGVELVARGEAPLAGISRSLTLAEKRLRLRHQIIGYDAQVVYVNARNPLRSLTRAQLKDIFTGRIARWSELGGADAPIVAITTRISDNRGQGVEFRDHAMDGLPYRADRREVDGAQAEQAAALAQEPLGIAVVSSSFQVPGIRAISLEGLHATAENVRSGAYMLSRPLVLVAPAHPAPDVRRFLDFMLSAEGQAVVARHFMAVR